MADSRKVIFILGSGHCGSTLLDLILGSHSTARSLGELSYLSKENAKQALTGSKYNVDEATAFYWDEEVVDFIAGQFAREKDLTHRLRHKLAAGWNRNRYAIYQRIFDKEEGTTVLVDSSKDPFYIRRSVAQLKGRDITPYVLFVHRDPRGVINSQYRKKPGITFEQHIARHATAMKGIETYYDALYTAKMKVSYEAFCQDPQYAIEQIVAWCGMPFEPAMLSFWKHDHIFLAGNSGPRTLIARFRDKVSRQRNMSDNKMYYFNHDLGIQLDERWRSELTEEQQQKVSQRFALPQ